jgi:hypothetical protein
MWDEWLILVHKMNLSYMWEGEIVWPWDAKAQQVESENRKQWMLEVEKTKDKFKVKV